MNHHVTQCGGQADGVIQLGHAAFGGEIHRGGTIHQQVSIQIRLGLELLDIKAVGLGVHVPIDLPKIIAGRVLAMLAELHRKAVIRRIVQAGEKPFDDEAGLQVQPPDLADDIRAEILLDGERQAALTITSYKLQMTNYGGNRSGLNL